MNQNAPRWQSDIFGILPHPTEQRILVVSEGEGWTLPHARLERSIWLHNLGIVSEELSRVLGERVRAYRYCHYEQDKERHWEEGVYLLEWAGRPEIATPGRQWVDRQAATDLALSRPEQHAMLDDYFRE